MTNTTKNISTHHIIIIALLVLNIGVTIWSSNQSERLEILKVGGQANWDKLQTIMNNEEYKNQYSQQFDALLQQIENPNTGAEAFGSFEEAPQDSEPVTLEETASAQEQAPIEDTIDIMDQNEAQGE